MSLLPLRIDAEFESQFKSADLKKIVRTNDGHFYASKSVDEHPLLPASEYLCYRLASACQIAVPFSTVLVDSGGNHYFGSRMESAATDFTREGPSKQLEMFSEAASQISAALAFDLFVGNEDRHRNNFLFQKNYKGVYAPFAIDYSRALLVRGFPKDEFPMPESSNTRSTIKQLKASDLWRGPYAVVSIGSLANVSAEHLRRWCDEMPSEWLPAKLKEEMLQWWASGARNDRLNAIYDLL